MKSLQTRYTTQTGIIVGAGMPGRWQHFDTSDGRERGVGPLYSSKAELMRDHTDYLLRAGWLRLTIQMPEPQLDVSVKYGCYAWAMEDIEVGIKVYGCTKAEAIAVFETAIADEFGGRVTIEQHVATTTAKEIEILLAVFC